MAGIFPLKGSVRNYDWGGQSFIPLLLEMENTDGRPFAEYWMGTHSGDNSMIELPGHRFQLLRDYIRENKLSRLEHLSYLLKVLDVKDMLSIQVHPSLAAARRDFMREDKAGIPIDAPGRNYKDKNHKPELMVALDDFWLLHGFKPEKKLIKILGSVPEFNELLPVFEKGEYKKLYQLVMEMQPAVVDRILRPLVERIVPQYKNGKLEKSSEDFWAARASLTFSSPHHIDRGIFSIYFFNLLHLKKNEAIFQDAGVPHAYLEGKNVEIMASSDNVLRGGLTNKHIDVKELLKHVKCEATVPAILHGERAGKFEKRFNTSVKDFELRVFDIAAGKAVSFTPDTYEILLLTEGVAEIESDGKSLVLKKGAVSALITPGGNVAIQAKENAVIFRAMVGREQ